jgi:hypothetical protein
MIGLSRRVKPLWIVCLVVASRYSSLERQGIVHRDAMNSALSLKGFWVWRFSYLLIARTSLYVLVGRALEGATSDAAYIVRIG